MLGRSYQSRTLLIIKLVYIALLFLVAFATNLFKCTLNILTMNIFLVYVSTVIMYKLILSEWVNVFSSIEFFAISMYVVYGILAPFQYIVDGYRPRVFYFSITSEDMADTTRLYLNVFLQICLWITILGYPKKSLIIREMKNFRIRRKHVVIADIIATSCVVFYAYLFLRNGISIFSLYIKNIRSMTNSEVNQYIYIYMVAYSFGSLSTMIIDRKIKKFDPARIFIISLFWVMSLFVDRKYFILMAIMVIIVLLTHIQKSRKPVLISAIILFFAMIAMGLAREGYLTGKLSLNDTLYYSGTEFVLVDYVSVFYIHRVDVGRELLHGLSYTYYVIAYFIPHVFFSGKPLTLGEVFYREAHPNVGFAFNPIAEGLMNFGSLSVFTTPLFIIIYLLFSEKVGKRYPLVYVLLFGYCVNFMRGMWAIMTFEVVLFFVVFYFFYRTSWIKESV